jgi:hypothetical protein
LALALREKDHDYVLCLGANLRSAALFDLDAIEMELFVLDRISRVREEQYLKELAAQVPDGRLARHVRMWQTRLGIASDRPDLIERDVARLPYASDVEVHQCTGVIGTIRHVDPTHALSMAYDLVRRYPDSPSSHEAIIIAMGLGAGEHQQPVIPHIDCAGVGTALALRDSQTGKVDWYVIEDAPDLKPTLHELGPGSSVAKAVEGRRPGDEVELDEPFGTKRRVVIDRCSTSGSSALSNASTVTRLSSPTKRSTRHFTSTPRCRPTWPSPRCWPSFKTSTATMQRP